MVKKKVKKKSVISKSRDELDEREEILIENFVGLQKAMTNLSLRFKELSDNISHLIKIFEDAAENVSKEDPFSITKEISNKLDNVLEQNKKIEKKILEAQEKNQRDVAVMQGSNPDTSSAPSAFAQKQFVQNPPKMQFQQKAYLSQSQSSTAPQGYNQPQAAGPGVQPQIFQQKNYPAANKESIEPQEQSQSQAAGPEVPDIPPPPSQSNQTKPLPKL